MSEGSSIHPARILVSSTQRPISYISLAKRLLQDHGELQLSALGIAVAPTVSLAEILKNRSLAVEKRILTSLVTLTRDFRTRQKPKHKPKMDIILSKSPDFDAIIEEEIERCQPLAKDSTAD